jgi:flagellar hook-associated protein 3 FlgL
MKISNTFLFDRASDQMSRVQAQMVKSQAQVASGKQVLKPSDEPQQAALIQRYKSLLARQENYVENIGLVKSRLDIESTAVESSIALMYRVKELTVQATNDTLSGPDRQAIATELTGLRDQLLSMANAQDAGGNFLFAGSRVGQTPFAPPAADPAAPEVYHGDRTRMEVLIGDQRTLPINRPGPEVFGRVVRVDGQGQSEGVGFFQALEDLTAAVANSEQSGMQRGNKEVDDLLTGLVLAQADIGTDMSNLEQQNETLEDLIITIKLNLGSVEDLDYTKAITLMNKQMMSLEAAQSSFAKISRLSLFDYLR